MVSLIVAGRLLGASLACGLNAYATIAVLGVASYMGWIEPLPPSLNGLENAVIIAAALVLLLLEITASAIPVVETAWEAVHTIVRPMIAMALVWLALEASPFAVQVAGASAAGTVAFAAHTAKVGLRLVEARRRSVRIAISTTEDLLAVGLVIAALAYPSVALGLAAAILAIMGIIGPRLWRAAAFGTRALTACTRGFFGIRDFRSAREIPGRLRTLVAAPEDGSPLPRAVRATLGAGVWRNGWLVFEGREAAFLCRRRMRSHRIAIAATAGSAVRQGLLADALDIEADGSPAILFLLKDGPVAEACAGALPLGMTRTVDPLVPAEVEGSDRMADPPVPAKVMGSHRTVDPPVPAEVMGSDRTADPGLVPGAGSRGTAVAVVVPVRSLVPYRPEPRPRGPVRV